MTEAELQKIVDEEVKVMRESVTILRCALSEIDTPDARAIKVQTDIIGNDVFLLDRWNSKLCQTTTTVAL